MAYQSASFDLALAAAAGHDPSLVAELRRGYADSVASHCDLLARARCDGNWITAAKRLSSLAASFHDETLMALAATALSSAPGEPTALRALRDHIAEIA